MRWQACCVSVVNQQCVCGDSAVCVCGGSPVYLCACVHVVASTMCVVASCVCVCVCERERVGERER